MTELLFKRTIRYLKENLIKYLALLILVAAIVAVVVVLEETAYTIINGRNTNSEIERTEDGQFSAIVEISAEDLDPIEEKYDVTIEDITGIDIEKNGFTYRVFKDRKEVDRPVVFQGKTPEKNNEIFIEQNAARDNGIAVGDTVTLRDREYTVCGTGSIPDYVRATRNKGDAGVTTDSFSWAIVSEDEYDSIIEKKEENETVEYTYAFTLGENADMTEFADAVYKLGEKSESFKDKLLIVGIISKLLGRDGYDDIPLLLSFTQRSDNHRIDEDLRYAGLYQIVGYFAGAFLIVLMAFIFSVFVRNQIHNDHLIIGSLYAMGVRKKSIVALYLVPGLVTSFFGGIIGLAVGCIPAISNIGLNAFHIVMSFPYYECTRPAFVILYALIMPAVVYFAISYLLLNSSLSKPVLSMIRGNYNEAKVKAGRIHVKGFIKNFQLSRIRADRSIAVISICVLFSIIIFMLGLNTGVMVKNNRDIAEEHMEYDNILILNESSDEMETTGDKVFLREVKTEKYDTNVQFLLIGIRRDCRTFDFDIEKGSHKAVVNKALASKLKLKTGDTIQFFEGINRERHQVTITGIVDSGVGLEMYMDISQMRKLYGAGKTYYNAISFKGEKDIDDSLVYSSIDKDEIIEGFGMMITAMIPFEKLTYISSIIIFFMTMLLIVDTLIDKNAAGISLLRVLGYRKKEIQRMYVNNIIYEVALALAVSLPLGKGICDIICPYIFSNLAMGMFFEIPWYGYILIYVCALAMFFAALLILYRKANSIETNEILKNRE